MQAFLTKNDENGNLAAQGSEALSNGDERDSYNLKTEFGGDYSVKKSVISM